jgi:uncharacterized repeat protein (TIGR02543 family)
MRRSLYAAAAVFLLALAGCDLMTGSESGQSAAQDGKAAVSLAITGTEARTVAPANAELADVKTWKLLGGKTGGGQDVLIDSFTDPTKETLHLETGDWDFTLEGYKDNPGETLILEGTITKQAITLEVRNTLNFTVAPVLEGTGTVRITINLPTEHGINQVKVFKGDDLLETRTLTPDVNSVVYENTAHAAGNYYYSFRLYKVDSASPNPDLYGVVSELIKVRANLTSEGTYTLNAEDLNLSYLITFNLNGGALDDPPDSYRSTDADLTLPEPDTRPGYTFEGWYGNEGLGGDPVTKIPQDSEGDKPFWAKWTRLTYTIEYELNGGDNHNENPASYNVESPAITLKNPTRDEYSFMGWYDNGGFSNDPITTILTGSTDPKKFYARWHKNGDSLASTTDLRDYIVNAAGGDSADDPIELPAVDINLADGGWTDLLTAISGAGKYVALDLSECTMAGTEFDPGTADTGESKIVSLVLPNAATSVKAGSRYGDNAGTFRFFTALTSVTGKVKTIGENAFIYHAALETVDFPEATTIGDNAFYVCSNLTTVTLTAATTIGENAFNNCSKLEEVKLPKAETIGVSAFNGCTSLEEVTLDKATTIGDYAFSSCDNLTTVNLPKAIDIGARAFQSCSKLEEVNLPEATTIGDNAFSTCPSLTEVKLPKVETIGNDAFRDCTALKQIELPATTIGGWAFNGCTALIEVKLPNATTIGLNSNEQGGGSVFGNCTALKTVSLPEATSIGATAFDGCTALKTVDLPKAISIWNGAFRDCTALEVLNLPEVTNIQYQVFQDTGTDIALTITLGSTAPTLGSAPFNNAGAKTVNVRVPDGESAGYDSTWITKLKSGNTSLDVHIETY